MKSRPNNLNPILGTLPQNPIMGFVEKRRAISVGQ
jgi:hypothetical protein